MLIIITDEWGDHTREITHPELMADDIVVIEETDSTLALAWRDDWEILGSVKFSERRWISVVVRAQDPLERMMLQLMWPTLDKSWFWQRGHQKLPPIGGG
jgi:hypothetical protein